MNTEALQQMFLEMDKQLKAQSAALQQVSQQISQAESSSKLLKATVSEINQSTSPEGHIWEGLGKVFALTPVEEYTSRLEKQEKQTTESLNALKVKRDYLKTSVENTAKSMQQILTGKQS